ncbi:MAG: putative ral secretion pathway protein [Rhodospirillales bacterium]|nr:putative ral secretion pathway protein [Rhodospirillales bacterium]
MYQAFYGLRQMPFDVAADASFLIETAGRQSALDAIADQVRRRTGVITLEGWPGAGKTELLRAYERGVDPDRVRVAWITRPDFDRPALFSLLAEMLAGPFAAPPPGQELKRLLTERATAGQTTVLLVDDTETLSDNALLALGSIADLAGQEESLVSIVLVVRPPFVALFARPAAAALDRRASVRVRLPLLTPAEARGLIEHRLNQSGAADPTRVLSPEAIEAIVVEAGGIPRRLLSLGDRVLQAGAVARRRPVDYATAEVAIHAGAPAPAAPVRVRPPISIERRSFSALETGVFQRIAHGVSRVAIPAMLLIVALGVGYWLWALSDDVGPRRQPADLVASPAPPPAPPPAPVPQMAAAAPPAPVPPSPPQAAPPAPAPAPVNLLFISARRGDTLRTLYRAAYRVPRYRPPFDQLLAANPDLTADRPLNAGELVALPGPLINQ